MFIILYILLILIEDINFSFYYFIKNHIKFFFLRKIIYLIIKFVLICEFPHLILSQVKKIYSFQVKLTHLSFN